MPQSIAERYLHMGMRLFGLLLLTVTAVPVRAQDSASAPPPRTLADGVYSAGQATRGEARFKTECGVCHVPSQFVGESFLGVWNGASVYDLLDLIRTTMPLDNPGGLSPATYAEVLAYIFKQNGLPAGRQDLPEQDDQLRRIRITTVRGER